MAAPVVTADTRCTQGSLHGEGALGTGEKMGTTDCPREIPMKTVPDKAFLTCGSENSSPVTSCFTTAAFPGMFLASTGTSRSIA